MTKIVITSDLHLGITTAAEIEPLVAAIAAERPDLTVIAGDIGEGETLIRDCLALFEGMPGEVAALGGNHDVWALSAPWKLGGPDSQTMWEQVLPGAVRDAGMRWLEAREWRAGGLAVTGSIAWYDYSGAAEDIPPQTEEYWIEFKRTLHPDAKFINWRWSDVDFATACGDALVANLEALEADGSVDSILLVTHVPIFREQLVIRPDIPNWRYGNAFFGNVTLGERVRGMAKLCAVVSGHTHIPVKTTTRHASGSLPVWVTASDFHKPSYVVYDGATGVVRDGAM
ncbi:MAG TPA: metallophosphoesterase [Ktedonobacterales bacterium]